MNLVEIKQMATIVRRWAERHQRRVNGRYDFDACDLACMCAYASTVLLAYLHRHGVVNAQLVHNDSHAFVMVDDYVVDITATQFRHKNRELQLRPVEVCKRKSLLKKVADYEKSMWTISQRATSVDIAFEMLRPKKDPSEGFPESQYWSKKQHMQKVVRNAISYCDGQLDLERKRAL